ncbi:hypothetical protein LARV_00943 [Longilinea arvoryzae]|uniref:Ribbon-helix-helix protein, copG family n=1 Tax=Longilinea arvoryzae TaxID=360412 RepID=A0A0S7BGC4_9CHLR|nr:hypothetical protein [Longilinea arvoryzae]GAP13192.1 hypothetical protein LARV_00943 [Longilinea arvoryzae]
MPKTNSANKQVHSFRLSRESIYQLKEMTSEMGRSESDVVEIALDRMYREELRFGRLVHDHGKPDDSYAVEKNNEEK